MPGFRAEGFACSITEDGDSLLGDPVFQVEVFEDVRGPLEAELQIVFAGSCDLLKGLIVRMPLDNNFLAGILGL